jgi:hypothetical protein
MTLPADSLELSAVNEGELAVDRMEVDYDVYDDDEGQVDTEDDEDEDEDEDDDDDDDDDDDFDPYFEEEEGGEPAEEV